MPKNQPSINTDSLIGKPPLPREILAKVLSYLNLTIQELARLIRISRSLKIVMSDLSLNQIMPSEPKNKELLKERLKKNREQYRNLRKSLRLDGSLSKGEYLSSEAVKIFLVLINNNEHLILKNTFSDYLKFHNPTIQAFNDKLHLIFDLILKTIMQRKVACLRAITEGVMNNIDTKKSALSSYIKDTTYLSKIIEKKYYELIRPMHKFGYDINQGLEFAILVNDKEAVELLVVEIYGSNGKSALSPVKSAVHCRDTRFLKYLISHGHDVNEKDDNNTTPLHIAIDQLNPEAIEVLLDAGADPKIRSNTLGSLIDIVRKHIIKTYFLKNVNLQIENLHLLNAIDRALGLSANWKISKFGSARCDLKPNDKYFLRSYSLEPTFIEEDCLLLDKITEDIDVKIKTKIENQNLLNKINSILGLRGTWITDISGDAYYCIMFGEMYLLDGYILDPIKRSFDEGLTLSYNKMSKDILLKIKSSIEEQIAARLSHSRSVLDNATHGLHSHCSLDDDQYIGSLPRLATNPYLFHYDYAIHEDASDQAEESMGPNCNN